MVNKTTEFIDIKTISENTYNMLHGLAMQSVNTDTLLEDETYKIEIQLTSTDVRTMIMLADIPMDTQFASSFDLFNKKKLEAEILLKNFRIVGIKATTYY